MIYRILGFVSLIFVASVMCDSAVAQEDPIPTIEWEKRLVDDARLTAYGSGLMGDAIDPSTGSITFSHVDVSIPGNSNLDVSVRRRLSQGYKYDRYTNVDFGNWELEVPKIEAITSKARGWAGNRCSGSWVENFPKVGWARRTGELSFNAGVVFAETYSNGASLIIPGHGSQEILKVAGGNMQTVNEWYLTCTTASDGGEGFIAHAPNGDQYDFKKFISRPYNTLGFANRGPSTIERNKSIFLATQVRDVHGNWVRYNYSSSNKLTSITSNDQRKISFTYDGDLISSVTANGRRWTYSYRNSNYEEQEWEAFPFEFYRKPYPGKVLSKVTLPDGLSWTFNLDAMQAMPKSAVRFCVPGRSLDLEIDHPNGTKGAFVLKPRQHRLVYKSYTSVGRDCLSNFEREPEANTSTPVGGTGYQPPYELLTARTMSVISKKLSGTDIQTANWSFAYEGVNPCLGLPSSACQDPNFQTAIRNIGQYVEPGPAHIYVGTKGASHKFNSEEMYTGNGQDILDFTNTATVTQPDGSKITYYHLWAYEEIFGGKEVLRIVKNSSGNEIERVETSYSQMGCKGTQAIAKTGANRSSGICPTLVTKTVHKRDGDVYTTEMDYEMDQSAVDYSFGHPVSRRSYSNVSTESRGSDIEYTHDTINWILGLPSKVYDVPSTGTRRERSRYTYTPNGQLESRTRYGEPWATYSYYDDGQIETITDALGRITKAPSWHRGKPETVIRALGTPDEITTSQVIDDNGWVTSQTDGRGYTTSYTNDIMGRLTQINPTGSYWVDTHIDYTFPPSGGAVQTITKGQSESTITYDSMFRPTLEKTQALDTGWKSYVKTTYDALGRVIFTSQPSSNEFETKGVDTTYDGLGRVYDVTETVAPFAKTKYRYLSNHRKQVFDPSGARTEYYSYGYDGPGNSDHRIILKYANGQELQKTQLFKNAYGQLVRLRQSGSNDGNSIASAQQLFFYNAQQRLCRHDVPEHGTTKYAYDAAGQMVAYAKGQPISGCGIVPDVPQKVTQSYDNLGRPILTNYRDPNTPDITKTYDKNGNVLTVNRGTGAAAVNWDYQYNELNMLTNETLTLDGLSFPMSYNYDKNGHLKGTTLPAGPTLSYVPDGLGRVTSVTSAATTLIGNVSFAANGALINANYGNGHQLTQIFNNRLLLDTRRVSDAGTALFDQQLTYNPYGKITSLTDHTDTANSRAYTYDGLGQLKTATGPWGTQTNSYDNLGNIISRVVTGTTSRTVTLQYDSKNRVNKSIDNVTSGANIWNSTGTRTVGYDERGNVTTLGSMAFVYDYSDQPIIVSGSSDGLNGTAGLTNGNYVYDGNMRRVKSVINGKTSYSIYNAAGQLVYNDEPTVNRRWQYIYANGENFARCRIDASGACNQMTYMIRDYLGSVARRIDQDGIVRREKAYAPFGEELGGTDTARDIMGYAGHVADAATGLNYMQARYYDPVIGRFLSVDPTTFTSSGGNPSYFNRYAYTFNDPINGIDPNGETVIQAMFAWNHGVSSNVKSNVHTALDVGGLVPGFGEIADGLNAGLYAAEGDFKNAAISGAALIPVVGSAGTVARLGSKVCCFVAGTLVETEYGLRPIEDLQVGDLVWARDEETGEEALKPVLGLIRLHDRVIWDLETVSETGEIHTFGTTDDHPWWVDGHGWKRTDELSPKDILVTLSGKKVSILSVTNTNLIEPTFNFEVADFNTYFVGESKVWVHNATKCGVNFDKAREAAFEKAGMTDGKVNFTMEDKATGTITEFTGAGGAKVNYDGPHPNTPGKPGDFHDQNHVGSQTAGKRGSGGTERQNFPYSGDQHPTRQNSRDLE